MSIPSFNSVLLLRSGRESIFPWNLKWLILIDFLTLGTLISVRSGACPLAPSWPGMIFHQACGLFASSLQHFLLSFPLLLSKLKIRLL